MRLPVSRKRGSFFNLIFIKKNRKKVFKVFKVSPLQLIYKDWLEKNLQTGKTSSRVLKNTLYESLQLVLASENISKFYK